MEGNTIWMRTTENAPNGKVVAVDLTRPQREHWQTLIPESEHVLIGTNVIGDRILTVYREHAKPVVKVFHTDGKLAYNLELPKLGFLSSFSGRQSHQTAYYTLNGLADPGTLYALDVASGKSKVFRKAELDYDPDQFITRQVFYTSKDGTRIPMFLVHRDGLKLNPETPVFLYGYGAGNWSAYPWHQPHMAVWLEMGGVYALPGIRGGGEYGYTWHEAGIGHNKQNAIDDFIASARWLIEQGYTSTKKLAINGGSASGPLVGAALVQEPDLFGAAVVEWPVTDMLRFEAFPGGRFWTWSNGSVKDPEDFRSLHAWSPYHNVTKGTHYPATLIIVGEQDESTVPAHGYKLQAALQHAQAGKNPILMRVIEDGAHYQYGATTEKSVDNWADLLAFLVGALDMKPVEFAVR
jgi:prolyl oligopeptidase